MLQEIRKTKARIDIAVHVVVSSVDYLCYYYVVCVHVVGHRVIMNDLFSSVLLLFC